MHERERESFYTMVASRGAPVALWETGVIAGGAQITHRLYTYPGSQPRMHSPAAIPHSRVGHTPCFNDTCRKGRGEVEVSEGGEVSV